MSFNKILTEPIIKKVLEEKISKLIDSPNMIDNICKEINNPFNFLCGLDHVISSSYTRSFSSSLGTHLQSAAVEIAKAHGWEVLNDTSNIAENKDNKIEIHGNYSDETRKIIDETMTYIGKSNKNNKLTNQVLNEFKAKIIDSVLMTVGVPILRHSDIIIGKKDSNDIFQISIIESKSGGDLDKGKSVSQRREILELYAILASKYKEGLRNGTVNINIFFATLYNKTDLFAGAENWKSSSVTKNFVKEELLIGKDFWNYICDDENAYIEIIKLYGKYSMITQQAIDNLRTKIKPLILEKIKNSNAEIKELYKYCLEE